MSLAERAATHRDDVEDLGRLLGALVLVEILASLAFSVGLVAWATLVTDASPTLYELLGGTAWIAGMTLSEVLLAELLRYGFVWESALIAVGCYAVAIAILAGAVRVGRWSR